MPPRHDLGNRFRQKRLAQFMALLEPVLQRKSEVSILDVGGTAAFWRALPGLYRDPRFRITIVNLDCEVSEQENLRIRPGDACALPFGDGEFDLVHSNSVIEHVGHWPEMSRMATEVRRVGSGYFVQTPNIWFPIEPHFKLPFVHWLPEPARMAVLGRTGRAPRDVAKATLSVQRIALLSAAQMKCLFPDAELWRERVAGLTKSLVAIRKPQL
jgi:hypothetical protein